MFVGLSTIVGWFSQKKKENNKKEKDLKFFDDNINYVNYV